MTIFRLWCAYGNAISKYVITCHGRPSSHIYAMTEREKIFHAYPVYDHNGMSPHLSLDHVAGRVDHGDLIRMLPLAAVQLGVGGRLVLRADTEQALEGVERVEAPVEAERELVQVRLEMLRAHAVVDAIQPRLQVAENQVDEREVFLCDLRIAVFHSGDVVEVIGELGVAHPAIGHDRGLRVDIGSDEALEMLGGARRDYAQAQPASVQTAALGDRLGLAVQFVGDWRAAPGLDGADHERLVVDTTALAALLTAHPRLVHLDVLALRADGRALLINHACPQLVEDLEGRLVARQPELALELDRRHAGGVRGDEIRTPEPDGQRRVAALHDSAGVQIRRLLALAAPQATGERGEAVGLARHVAVRADEALGPADLFEIAGARGLVGEEAHELGQGLGEVEIGAHLRHALARGLDRDFLQVKFAQLLANHCPEGLCRDVLRGRDAGLLHLLELLGERGHRLVLDDGVADLFFRPQGARPLVGSRAVHDVPVLHAGLQAADAVGVLELGVGEGRLDADLLRRLDGALPVRQRVRALVTIRCEDGGTALDTRRLLRAEAVVDHNVLAGGVLLQPPVKWRRLEPVRTEDFVPVAHLERLGLHNHVELVLVLPADHVGVGNGQPQVIGNLLLEPLDVLVLGGRIDVVVHKDDVVLPELTNDLNGDEGRPHPTGETDNVQFVFHVSKINSDAFGCQPDKHEIFLKETLTAAANRNRAEADAAVLREALQQTKDCLLSIVSVVARSTGCSDESDLIEHCEAALNGNAGKAFLNERNRIAVALSHLFVDSGVSLSLKPDVGEGFDLGDAITQWGLAVVEELNRLRALVNSLSVAKTQ